jgi:RNA polymerase primary sigma factor
VVKKKETVERTDDPVRMYLREMGAVELLSREGEIAIAKRIEAGRDTMILGLCESPITFHAIIQWSEALNNGEMQLREILDLDAMLSKEPQPENLSDGGEDADGEIRIDRRPFLQGRGRRRGGGIRRRGG